MLEITYEQQRYVAITKFTAEMMIHTICQTRLQKNCLISSALSGLMYCTASARACPVGGGSRFFSHSAISSVSISAESSLSALMAARVLCSIHRNVPIVFHLARKGNRHLQTSAMCSLASGFGCGWLGTVVGERAG